MIKKTFANGTVIYGYYDLYRDFIPHRKEKNGPAEIYPNGTEVWFNNGKRHREDGPAVICSNGTEVWFNNGKRHREDGPAEIYPNGTKVWFNNGKRHREDGPAEIYPNGTKQWWIDGEPVTLKLEKWFKKRNIDKNDISEEDKMALYKDIGIKIMENTIKVFYVYNNTDLTEGRGKEYVLHVCYNETTAHRLAKGNYVQGLNCPVKEGYIEFRDGTWWQRLGYVMPPSEEDKRVENDMNNKNLIIKKMKDAGFTDDDISAIRS